MLNGIDVSHNNGAVDWQKVAAAGIRFAYLKATEGSSFTDPRFATWWAAARDAGIARGAYHFFHPATSPEAQADRFATVVGALEAGDLPPVIDLEESGSPDEWPAIAPGQRLQFVGRFLNRVQSRYGIDPIIYTRRGWIAQFLANALPLARYRLWIAEYSNNPQPALPAPWLTWTFWQHSESGSVDGVSGRVDLNRFSGSLADLAALGTEAPAALAV